MRNRRIMSYDNVRKIYHNYANIYDFLFKQVFLPRQLHAIRTMNIKPREKVLDVGIGTGLSLTCYPRHCEVTGIDLSGAMLEKAEKKKRKHNLNHVRLLEMDACNLKFDDDTFDHVIATFVISVVPEPLKALSEMMRVCKAGRPLILVNHFHSDNKIIAKAEKIFDPICKKLGWCATVGLSDLIMEAGLQVNSVSRMKKYDPWSIVVATNIK